MIKIESSRRQDPTRFSPAMHLSRDDNFNPDASGYFNNFNRNKRSVTLDLRASESIEVSRRLVAASDVVIENFSYGVMQRMGLDYMTMQGLRDDIIYVSMSGMGHTGPWRDWVSYADTVSAASGLTAMTGWATDQVVGVIYGHGDIVAGTHAALAVLDALQARRQSGQGRHIDLSQMEAMAAHMGTSLLEWTAHGQRPEPIGNRHPRWVPHGVFPTLGVDRWVALTVRARNEWQRLVAVVDDPRLDDPTLADVATRPAHADQVDAALANWTQTQTAVSVVDRLQRIGIPCAAVQDGRDLVTDDPHLHARGFYVPVDHPVAGTSVVEGVPVQMGNTPGGVRTPAPLLGQHTDAVLSEVGYTAVQIERLRSRGLLQ